MLCESGNLEALMQLYEPDAAVAAQPGSLTPCLAGVREALAGFVEMNGKLHLKDTRVLEVKELALVIGVWFFSGTGPDGKETKLASRSADVLRNQTDGSWRFVIDNPWGDGLKFTSGINDGRTAFRTALNFDSPSRMLSVKT